MGQQSGRHAKASAAHRKRNKGKGKGKAGGSGSGGGGGSGGKARRSLELQEQQAELERAADCGDVETIRTLAAAGADPLRRFLTTGASRLLGMGDTRGVVGPSVTSMPGSIA